MTSRIITSGRWLLRDWPADAAGRKNMLLLIQLRWIAVAGQVATILVVHYGMGIVLPLPLMLLVPVAASIVNFASMAILRRRRDFAHAELFLALLFDVLSLTVQLYLSGGATNPFVSLYLLQVVLGAILLDRRSIWGIVTVSSACAALLSQFHVPLALSPRFEGRLFDLHITGTWICFTLIAVLLVLFMARINGNLQAREAYLARLRQQAAEEEHIIRMGLLASGAAHELGTPLSSLAVVLNDWQHMPEITAHPALAGEVEEMQAEVRRCKTIVTAILQSAGEARGEAPEISTVQKFIGGIIRDWKALYPGIALTCRCQSDHYPRIISDPVIRQAIGNLLDNAREAGATRIEIAVQCEPTVLHIAVSDNGPGFPPAMLAQFGKPYNSSKGKQGGGLGLFLVVNVVRKLGGESFASNPETGGALVILRLPLSTIAIEDPAHAG
jgi:two-component system sensor histidine kinase RegB